ncbi:hypothetical protein C8Q80DRAFT_1114999, partial [Daedaleopsis nitida]
WMKGMQETGGLLDGILAVTHPALYREAQNMLPKLCARLSGLRGLLYNWPTCYNVAQVVTNRMSLYHVDTSGRPGWLDLLLTLGTYGETAVVQLRNLGATVPFDSGSVVMTASKAVVHGVPKTPPDRVATEFFMLDNLHEWVGAADPGWAKYSEIVPF